MKVKCRCGRIGIHCPSNNCGSINKQPMIQETRLLIRQTGESNIRCFRCRKCGCQYSFLGNDLYDGVCYAPEKDDVIPQMETEELVKSLNEAMDLIQRYGGIVEFKHGILEKPVESEKEKGNGNRDTNAEGGSSPTDLQAGDNPKREEELPEGWTRNEEGQLVPPMSADELFARMNKKPPEDENEDKDKTQPDS
jgi:hypothetical protein